MNRLLQAAFVAGAMLIAVTSVQGASITVTNALFEESGDAFPGGFDIVGNDVPGWRDLTITDAGVEGAGAWWGTYEGNSAFMASGNGTYNLTGYTIQDGDQYTVGFVAKSWDNASEFTVTLFYDDPANVIGTYVTAVDGTWTKYSNPDPIAATAGSIGKKLGVSFVASGTGFGNLDNVSIDTFPFAISVSPAGIVYETNQTVEATIDNINSSTFVSATLSLDGTVVDSDDSGSGTTRTLSYTTDLSLGVHTGEVVAVSSTETMTNTWTIDVQQPAVESITVIGPTGWSTDTSQTLEVEVIELFQTVANSTAIYLDGVAKSTSIDRTSAPTTTVSAVVAGISEGMHTGKVVVVGSDGYLGTNEWTFGVLIDDTSKPVSMVHHWDFNEGSGTTVIDSVGGMNGTIIGDNYSWVAGKLDLAGGGTGANWNPGSTNTATAGSYVDLPNGIISALGAAATFEAVYIKESNDSWQRVWDFGQSDQGEDSSNLAADDIFLTCHVGGTGAARMELSSASPGYNNVVVNITSPDETPVDELTHVVVTYDSDELRTKLYVNGELVDANVSFGTIFPLEFLTDDNNWFGRAQYNDPMFGGKLDDIRIYDGIMTTAEVAARYEEITGGGGPTLNPDLDTIIVSGDSATLVWKSESGVTYSILSKTSLLDASWTTKKSGIASAGDGTTSDSVPATNDVEVFQIMGE